MKRAVLVNGIPASGKSTVARAISNEKQWPLLALDTIKEAFFAHLGTGDRNYNRMLGKASYQAIFALVRDLPAGSTVIIDAWFGFQPVEVLQRHIGLAGLNQIVEVWCHAPGPILGERYGARLGQRHAGHLGESYIPELISLAETARPIGLYPVREVDTTKPFDTSSVLNWVEKGLAESKILRS